MMEQEQTWNDIKDIWSNSSKGAKINFQVSELINELKDKVSQWEKDAVKSDMIKVKSSWDKFKGNVSQWEKDAVSKDLSKIAVLIKNIIKKFKRKN